MSNARDILGEGGHAEPTQRPAVGIRAQPGESNAVIGAVLRARSAGYHVIVGSVAPDEIESLLANQELTASVIDTNGVHSSIENRDTAELNQQCPQRLSQVARDRGFPGVIFQTDPNTRVDFEGSAEQLQSNSEYVVHAESLPVVDPAPSTLVAIPAYNEEATITDVVTSASDHAAEVLVVDDGSNDETATRARRAGAAVIQHDTNQGYGAALQTAFNEANRCDAAHLVIIDGDGQHDPTDITKLVATQRETDAEIVIGSRSIDGARTNMPLYRRFGLAVVNWTTNLSIGTVRSEERIEDTQSGFRAYDATAIKSLADTAKLDTSMGASTDIIHHAQSQGFDFAEIPTTIDYDVENGSSQHPISHGLGLIRNILRVVEREHPVLLLGVPGFASSVIGVGIAYATIVNLTTTGSFPLGLALLSVFFVLLGVFSCFTAIILHSLNQIHRWQSNTPRE